MTIAEFNTAYPHLLMPTENENLIYNFINVAEIKADTNSFLMMANYTTKVSGFTSTEFAYRPLTAAGFTEKWFSFKMPNSAWMKIKD